jgi:hypothetical protein
MKISEMTPEQIETRRASQRTEEYKRDKRLRDEKYRERKNNLLENKIKKREKLSPEESKRRRREREKVKKKRRNDKNKQWLIDHKKEKSCSMCGYNIHTEILQFHHTDPKNKEFEVARKKDKSLDSLKKEIEKCVLLCPNCHSWLHFNERAEKIKQIKNTQTQEVLLPKCTSQNFLNF